MLATLGSLHTCSHAFNHPWTHTLRDHTPCESVRQPFGRPLYTDATWKVLQSLVRQVSTGTKITLVARHPQRLEANSLPSTCPQCLPLVAFPDFPAPGPTRSYLSSSCSYSQHQRAWSLDSTLGSWPGLNICHTSPSLDLATAWTPPVVTGNSF